METWGFAFNHKRHMIGFEIYVFVLCLIVFVLLTAMFSYLIGHITKMELQFIRFGHRDEAIKKEKEKQLNKNKNLSQAILWFNRILSLILCLILIGVFAFAIYVRATEDRPANGIPSIKVVKSESMAKKNAKNEHLFLYGLDDQIQMFDIVICNHIPEEEDLELYDVVVYEKDGMQVIHRIVGIEEPNKKHPNERHFLLQGDANERTDQFPVLYSQMKGIYEGQRIQYVGSFLLFLQSPAGWLCVLLIVFGMIISPIVERLIENEKKKRLALLFPCKEDDEKCKNRKRYNLSAEQTLITKYANSDSLCSVGTNVLDRHYQDDDVVSISSLKEKRLIRPASKRLKIISVGKLSKRLTVHAHYCTDPARRAIIEAGGALKLLQDQAHESKEGDND